MSILRDEKGSIVNSADLSYSDVAGQQVVCPGCKDYLFLHWPSGWDAHAAHRCSGISGGAHVERKAAYKKRFSHLFRGNAGFLPSTQEVRQSNQSDSLAETSAGFGMDTKRFPELIQKIYRAVDELERMFPGRHFTPDGHMVGSIGETLAAFHYGIELFTASFKGHDGSVGGRLVQIKATQGGTISLGSEPDSLLVLRLSRHGSFEEIYNGPGAWVWALVRDKPLPKNGQYQVRLSSQRALMTRVPAEERIPKISV